MILNASITEPHRPTSYLLGFDPKNATLSVGIHKDALPMLMEATKNTRSKAVKEIIEAAHSLSFFKPCSPDTSWGFGSCLVRPIVSNFGCYNLWKLPLKTEWDNDRELQNQAHKLRRHYDFVATIKLLLDVGNRFKAEQDPRLPQQDLHIDIQLSIGSMDSSSLEVLIAPNLKNWISDQQYNTLEPMLRKAMNTTAKQIHPLTKPTYKASIDLPGFLGLSGSTATSASIQGSLRPEVPTLRSHNLSGPSQMLPFLAAFSALTQRYHES